MQFIVNSKRSKLCFYFFTRYRGGFEPSLLDLVFTNEENMIESINHMSGLGKSDHLQLEFIFNCYTEITQTLVTKLIFFKELLYQLVWRTCPFELAPRIQWM